MKYFRCQMKTLYIYIFLMKHKINLCNNYINIKTLVLKGIELVVIFYFTERKI